MSWDGAHISVHRLSGEEEEEVIHRCWEWVGGGTRRTGFNPIVRVILVHGAVRIQTQSFPLILNGRFLSRAIVGI